jgi:valyl-tRNA synthetase
MCFARAAAVCCSLSIHPQIIFLRALTPSHAPKPQVEKGPFVNTTPKGEKKSLSEFSTEYEPQAVEAAWQDWWEASGFYECDPASSLGLPASEKFVMTIPPPNVTGTLHLGHALMGSIEDCITRWHRMSGRKALWVPGTDHAGIATQSVVEKQLYKETQQTRHDLGRAAFLDKVWEWKKTNAGRITQQLRSLGASCAWQRECFTMDEKLNVAVREAFVRMYDKGIIYREERLVNWCVSACARACGIL